MVTKEIAELEQIHIYGRTTFSECGLNLFWSGSGLDFLFDGTELSMCYEADFDRMEPWISLLVDGAWIMRVPASRGVHTVSLVRGLTSGTLHRIQILKDTQAMADDPIQRLSIQTLTYEGQILAPPKTTLNIEFIGDSITSGEGCIGAKMESDWVTAFFSAVPAYGRKTAEKLNADYRIVSQSGWGVYCAWDNNPHCNLPSCYDYVCNLTSSQTRDGRELYSRKQNDFASWKADVVVINLGTNDEASFHNPSYCEPATGLVYKNRMLQDGSYHPEDMECVVRAQKQFLRKIRSNNPGAAIIWCYGMLGTQLSDIFAESIRAYQEEDQDFRVYYLELPEMTEETVGSGKHPGPRSHEIVSNILADFIDRLERTETDYEKRL